MKFAHELKFEHEGKAGDVVVLSKECGYRFRVDRFVATDSDKGVGTYVLDYLVDDVSLRFLGCPPATVAALCDKGTMSAFFCDTVKNGMIGGTGKKVGLVIKFRIDCKFEATVEGETVEEEKAS